MLRQQVLQVGIAAVLVILFLVGCGGGAPTAVSEAPAETSAPEQPAETPTPEPPTATVPPTDTPEPSATPIVNGKWRITGTDVPALASFDNTLQAFMQEHGISAGALAVTYQGRLIMAHGYTWDDDQSYATQPTSLFRIASLSKPITAVAVLKLVQDDQLSLDARITDILTFVPPAGQSIDPRLGEVTVAHLLYHRGGWDIEELGYDPMFNDFLISESLKVPLPISQANIVTFMSGVPLNYDPGTKYAYSNYGYMLLGRIIEAVSKQPYETYIKQNVLEPLGITRTQLGRSLPENRLPGEVKYHSDFMGTTVFDASKKSVPWPDGGWNLENMDAHGGWVSTVIDMARVEASFDQPGNNPVLTQDSIQLMFKAPPGATGERYYAMGWEIVRIGSNAMNTWHGGSLDGTFALMVRRFDGVGWVVVFNERDSRSDPTGDGYWEIDSMLHDAADAVDSWPDHDLFQQLP